MSKTVEELELQISSDLGAIRLNQLEETLRADRREKHAAKFRRETRARFDKVDARFQAVDARFDKVDDRFQAVDDRFDKVDDQFDAVDARFDQVDDRFDKVEAIVQEILKIVSAEK